MKNYFSETLFDSYTQQFSVDKVYFQHKTEHQDLLIFHNAKFGRVMALDGIIQTTEADEFIYHEMLSHVPIFAHGAVKKVLIIGGGDGGMLREVTKHQAIESITQVEIDQNVVDMCKKYLPNHSNGAYDDERVNLIIDDGLSFVQNSQEKFDLIISDSTDPIGPGEALFSSDYYQACHNCLNPHGILVTQNGVVYFQLDELKQTAQRIAPYFKDWHFYSAAVPTYVGGIMTFGFASDDLSVRGTDQKTLEKRYLESKITTRYYNPAIHIASFALPQYVLQAIGKR